MSRKVINRHGKKVDFHCCDKCSAGFGTIHYPDIDFECPDNEPILLKIRKRTYELCPDCYQKYEKQARTKNT